MVKLADELREKKVKIGFFSSTPQGGTWNFFQKSFLLWLILSVQAESLSYVSILYIILPLILHY